MKMQIIAVHCNLNMPPVRSKMYSTVKKKTCLSPKISGIYFHLYLYLSNFLAKMKHTDALA